MTLPAMKIFTGNANPALARAQATAPVSVIVHNDDCSVQFDPIGKNKFDAKSCDIAKSFLAKSGVSYTKVEAEAGAIAQIKVGAQTFVAPDPAKLAGDERKAAITAYQAELKAALVTAGYPTKADPDAIDSDPKLQLLVRMLAGASFPGWSLVLAPVFESLMWPVVTMVMLAPQRRPPDRDKNRPL